MRNNAPARFLLAAGGALVVVSLWGCVTGAGPATDRAADGAPEPRSLTGVPALRTPGDDLPRGTPSRRPAASATSVPTRPLAASVDATRPVRLVIPALAVDAPVQDIGLRPDRVLVPPRDPKTVGWWREGALPGARTGTAVIAGHSVHRGEGALDDVDRLRPGNTVEVHGRTGTLRYRVSRVATYPKSAIARQAQGIFRQDGPGQLVIVTCGDWNGRYYESNVVAFAGPD